jgi:PIN domain nuclease of toxin-antitoxin system
LAQIAVDTDLLATVAKKKTHVNLEDISVSLISLFELQAKAAKLKIPAKSTIRAVDAILTGFRIIPFYESEVIEAAQKIRKTIPDYVDCIILATALATKQEVVTQDSLVLQKKNKLLEEYNLRVLSFSDLVET